eukprot:TRINITY_DN1732_c0_g1_i2.p3 TRINITY_DN1732_c0_g1~~TRINITY_DN1732_c0_g1_i2.p3  ORF type:complete len:126 (+),score=18.77 TRINITY_DN1732_c0_g1_i2:2142-2519(+)
MGTRSHSSTQRYYSDTRAILHWGRPHAHSMISSGPIKVLATRDQVVGQVKVTVGKTIRNHRMEAEGHKQQDHGTAEKQAAAAKHTADGTSDRLLCQNATGPILGNERLHSDGEVYKAKGRVSTAT